MALPETTETTWLSILEIVDSKGKAHTTNFSGIYNDFIKKLNIGQKEITIEIENGILVVKEILKIGRDNLLALGLLKGTPTSFEISKNGKTFLKKCISLKISNLSYIPDELYEFINFDYERGKKLVTINEIEYSVRGWEKKVFKFAEEYNKQSTTKSTFNTSNFGTKHTNKTTINAPNLETKNTKFDKKVSEVIKELIETHNELMKRELLEKLQNIGHFDFEDLAKDFVCDFLYNNITPELRKQVTHLTPKTGDGGIDGIVTKIDRFGGGKKFYIQAKRYKKNNTVGSEDVRLFFSDLMIKGANDGLFITTSVFSPSAKNSIKEIHSMKNVQIIPIDGEKLVELMIENNIGIKSHKIEYKEIEESYFIKK